MLRAAVLCAPLLLSIVLRDAAGTTAIANWDCVPYQVFDTTFQLGVVAFHETGVDVEFFADGNPIGRVSDPTFNRRTGVYEYWIELDAAEYADGPVVMTATAVPDVAGHSSRELDSLTLFANAGETLHSGDVKWVDCDNGDDSADGTRDDPYETIERAITRVEDGGTVYLKASRNYVLTSRYPTAHHSRWTTVRAAPGLSADDVHIAGNSHDGTSSGRYGDDMIRWCSVSFYTDQPEGYHTVFYFNSGQHVWFDSVTIYDVHGRWNGGQPLNGNSPYYVYTTNSLVRDMGNGLGGLRNNTNVNIGSDIYRPGDNTISIDFTLHTIDKGATAAHPDFFQCYCTDGLKENVILYNMKAYNMGAQGIFGCNDGCALRDVAFVNILLEKDPPESSLISQPGNMEHVLAWHFTTVDQGWAFRNPSNVSRWVVKNGNWANFNAGEVTALDQSDISHNHFAGLSWNQPSPLGTEATVGDQGFVDTANDDYRVTPQSPCYRSGIPLPGVPADIDGVLYDSDSPNRGCFAAANMNGVVAGRYMRTGRQAIAVRATARGVHVEICPNLRDGARVCLFDLTGRVLAAHMLREGERTIRFEGLRGGCYAVELAGADGGRTARCVVR